MPPGYVGLSLSSKTKRRRKRPSSSASRLKPGSSVEPSTSYIRNRFSLVASAKSRRLTRISGDMLMMLMVSLASAVVPALRALIGLRTNGSSLVPAPDKKSGSEVVFSGSGPNRTALSRINNGMRNNRTSKRMIRGRHHKKTPLLSSSASSEYLPSMQFPSISTSGTLVWLVGSLPHLSSMASR